MCTSNAGVETIRTCQDVAMCCSVVERGGVCWSVLECVGMCWNVLQCVAVCWSVNVYQYCGGSGGLCVSWYDNG